MPKTAEDAALRLIFGRLQFGQVPSAEGREPRIALQGSRAMFATVL